MTNEGKNGYTLIEILVALTIVGLIFGIGYVSFRDFARRQAVAGLARSVVGDLRLAQEQSLSGKKPSDIFCDSPNTLNGYNFRVVSSQNYVLEANCSGGNVQTKSVTLPSDLFISTPNPNPITFKILGEGTNLGSADATMTVSQTGTTHTRAISVSQSGEIK
jgi:prepilin-type N-terminal cleavage/methylation domain-containing protein